MMTPAEVDFVEAQDRMLKALFSRDELSKRLAKMSISAGALPLGVTQRLAVEKSRLLAMELRESDVAFSQSVEVFRTALDKLIAEREELERFLIQQGEKKK